MQQAIAVQPFDDQFKEYLLAALNIPAERVRQVNSGEI
jgi:hemoglobin